MAIYYLRRTGTDSTAGGRDGLTNVDAKAWKTIPFGLTQATTGDIIILGDGGTYTEGNSGANKTLHVTKAITIDGLGTASIICDGASEGCIALGDWTPGPVTLRNLAHIGFSTGTNGYSVISHQGNAGLATLTLNNVVVDDSAADESTITWFVNTEALTIINSTIGKGDAGAKKSIYYINPASALGNLSITGSTLRGQIHVLSAQAIGNITLSNVTANGVNVLSVASAVTHGNISMADCDFSAITGGVFLTNAAATYGNIAFTGNTVKLNSGSVGIYFGDKVGTVTITGNTLTLAAGLGSYDIIAGAGMQPADTPGAIGVVTIEDNVITNASAGNLLGAHGVFLGKGVTTASVKRNKVKGCAFGVVLKDTSGATVHNNVLDCGAPLLIKDGTTLCDVQYNALRGGLIAEGTGDESDNHAPITIWTTTSSVVSNNVCIAKGCRHVLYDVLGDLGNTNLFDHNQYIDYGITSAFAWLNGIRANLAGIQTGWAAYGGASAANDANSTEHVETVPSWVTVTPRVDRNTGTTQTLTLAFTTTGLAVGSYSSRVNIYSPETDLVEIPITLTVT